MSDGQRSARGLALALTIAFGLSGGAALGCSVDQRENDAYRACNERDDTCGPGAHCYRGYCVAEGADQRASASETLESPSRAQAGSTAREPRAGSGARSTPAAGSSGDGPQSMAPEPNAGSGAPPADAGASTPASGAEPPASSEPAPPASNTPPPSEPPPSEPPDDPDPPPPAAPCKPKPETCNRADEDCDGKSDEGFALQTDSANCGRCGNTCPGGESCCNGNCIDTSRTPTHCGECGHECTGLLQACCTGVCKTLCLL